MSPRRIFITGASGCLGHYVAEALLPQPDVELYLLVRDPARLQLDPRARPGVTVLPGTMRDIARYGDLLKTVHVAVLAAASWGGPAVYETNVTRTIELLTLLDPAVCAHAVYLSTASILDRSQRPLPQAAEIGTPYIRSKYECLQRLPGVAIAPRITVLFPTVVLGGDASEPATRFLADTVPKSVRWMDLLRFLRIDAGLHFIHARDIARMVTYLIDQPPAGDGPRWYVLGQEALTVDQAVEETCAYLGKPIYFRIPVPVGLLGSLAALVPRSVPPQDRAWTRYCFRVRHFTYARPVNPASFGLPTHCATLTEFLRLNGIPQGRAVRAAVRRLG